MRQLRGRDCKKDLKGGKEKFTAQFSYISIVTIVRITEGDNKICWKFVYFELYLFHAPSCSSLVEIMIKSTNYFKLYGHISIFVHIKEYEKKSES